MAHFQTRLIHWLVGRHGTSERPNGFGNPSFDVILSKVIRQSFVGLKVLSLCDDDGRSTSNRILLLHRRLPPLICRDSFHDNPARLGYPHD